MVVLGAELVVYSEDCGGRARYDREAERDEQETEHVVELHAPEGRKDEEELAEDGDERWETAEEHGRYWASEPDAEAGVR